nr:MAG TPA: hypothetical protein [Caudoviricetes sp.]
MWVLAEAARNRICRGEKREEMVMVLKRDDKLYQTNILCVHKAQVYLVKCLIISCHSQILNLLHVSLRIFLYICSQIMTI